MALFDNYPTYERYRPLKLRDPKLRGEDVYALQTAISAIVVTLTHDGILGAATSGGIKRLQTKLGLVADGVAGPATQGAALRRLTAGAANAAGIPHMLLFGQVSFECGLVIGNYSPQRPDGSYDAGPTQRNTAHHDPEDAFDAPGSINLLAFTTRKFFEEFVGVKSEYRRWQLAAGAWNAPAYARWIAKQEGATLVKTVNTKQPGPTARAALESYMDHATALL